MNNLLQLLIRNGGFVSFVVLEAFCFYLLINFNERQQGIFAHTSMIFNQAQAARRASVDRYFAAADSLKSLENKFFQLQTELDNARSIQVFRHDTSFWVNVDSVRGKIYIPRYQFISAEVVSNNITNRNNWLTINRGSNHKVHPNMGVVANDGLVGIVRYVSPDFAMVMSLLHSQTKISASLKKQGFFGSLIWEGGDPTLMTLTDIPKHVTVQKGDTVITSGYSSMFPRGVMIGRVERDSIPSGSNFYSITVKLSHDLSKTDYVRVVENLFQAQIDSLQKKALSNE